MIIIESIDNELTKVEGFSGLNYLQVLDLSHNKIETIIEIDCPSLISLHLVRQ